MHVNHLCILLWIFTKSKPFNHMTSMTNLVCSYRCYEGKKFNLFWWFYCQWPFGLADREMPWPQILIILFIQFRLYCYNIASMATRAYCQISLVCILERTVNYHWILQSPHPTQKTHSETSSLAIVNRISHSSLKGNLTWKQATMPKIDIEDMRRQHINISKKGCTWKWYQSYVMVPEGV